MRLSTSSGERVEDLAAIDQKDNCICRQRSLPNIKLLMYIRLGQASTWEIRVMKPEDWKYRSDARC